MQQTDDDRISMWRDRIASIAATDMTQQEWCSEHGISYGSLRYWRDKIRKLDSASDTKWLQVPEPSNADETKYGSIAVTGRGIEIRLTSDADPAVVAEIMKAMMQQ